MMRSVIFSTLHTFFQMTSRLGLECQTHLDECVSLEASRHEVLIDAEKRLKAISDIKENISKAKEELVKERKRLLNTRNSILCTSCQQPLAADRLEMEKQGWTNLGLRTAGDGEHHNFLDVRTADVKLFCWRLLTMFSFHSDYSHLTP